MPTLHWLTKDEDAKAASKVPYRLLEEVPELGAGDRSLGNMILQGDNLEALKSLLPFYAGQVKCIYIDPPYNTGQAFAKYDDNMEHSIWLGMMYARLEYLKELLHPSGSIFVHLDDNELDYAKTMLDEIFGRSNFVSRITIKARSPSAFSTVNPGVFKASEYVLWFAKDKSKLNQQRVWVPREPDTAYNKWHSNPDESPENWNFEALSPKLAETVKTASSLTTINKKVREFYISNAARIVRLAEIDDEGAGEEIVDLKKKSLKKLGTVLHLVREKYDDVYVLNGQQILFYQKNIREIDGEKTPARMLTNIWDDISWEGIANEGDVRLPKGKKPERLIRRCLQLTTNLGDLVVDSFLGSGSTAAVAAKMGRKFIGIERGEHAQSLARVRLENVVMGDTSGISKLEKWSGGGWL